MGKAVPWKDEDVDMLKKLVLTGKLSAGAIGQRLGKTRNSVIGKVLRLGLRLPGAIGPRGSMQAERVRKVRKPKAPVPLLAEKPVQPHLVADVLPYRVPEPRPPRATPRPRSSPFQTCQWYFGDPKSGDFSQCCKKTHGDSSFCEDHYHVVYVPVQPRVRRA